MDVFAFDFNGVAHTAENAGWETNGEQVWDIYVEGTDEFVASVTVSPFSDIEKTVQKWAEMEICYA